MIDFPSFAAGFIVCAFVTGAYFYGQYRTIRLLRRIVRHGRDLDRVFFEDAEGDPTIETPKKVSPRADLHAIDERPSGR